MEIIHLEEKVSTNLLFLYCDNASRLEVAS